MDAHKRTLVSLFSGDETRYIIPVYQRNYNWGNKQCKRLFNDLVSVIGTERMHFFGSVVETYDRNDSYQIIDGQQRLTTVSLIWLAMLQLIKDGAKVPDDEELITRIRNKVAFKSHGQLLSKMVHVEKDRKAYQALIDGNKDHYVQDSNVTRNFCLFYQWIKDSEYTLEDFEDAVKKLEVVKIELEKSDNPQLIFESLNSTGLALSDGDKIRNFILMNQNVDKQQRLYEDYWTDIEKFSNFTCDEHAALNAVTFFVRDFLTVKTGRIPSLQNVYSAFKSYAEGSKAEDLLRDMKKYARYLWQIENACTGNSKIDNVFKRLALLEMTVTHPFTFKLMEAFSEQTLTDKEFTDILEVIESYILRRLICEVPTNALNKIFASLYDSANKLSENAGISFYDGVVFLLTSKTDAGRFPKDEEFKEALGKKNVYKMRAKNKTYIFFRLNAGNSAEGDTSVIDKMQAVGDNALTIEHVMPQTLSSSWIDALGGETEADRIQERWENTIANLTLTGYNSSYSNSDFETKLNLRDADGMGIGFAFSPLHINEYIKHQTVWCEAQLQERLQLIQQEAAETIWKYPKVTYTPVVPENDEMTLEDDADDFTNTSFVDGTLAGTPIPQHGGSTWKQVAITVIKMLDRDYHFDMVRIANDDSLVCLQNESSKFANSVKIMDGIYAYLNSSTATKINILSSLFDNLDLDRDSLRMHVKHTGKEEV